MEKIYENPVIGRSGLQRFDWVGFLPGRSLAWGGSGGTTTNQTVPTGPYAPQIPYIQGLFQEAANLYNQGPPQAFPGVNGQLTADINPNLANTQGAVGQIAGNNIQQNNGLQGLLESMAFSQPGGQTFGNSFQGGITQGINAQLGAGNNALTNSAQQQQGNVQNALNTVFSQTPQNVTIGGTQGGSSDASGALAQQLAGGGGQNPYLDAMVQGAIDSQVTAFNRNVLPGLGQEANAAGQFGGSRQGIAEGIAAGDLTRSIGNTASSIYGNAFGQQAALQGQAVQNVLNAQQGDQSAQLQAAQINNQNNQAYIQQLLQGAGQVNSNLGQGLGLGFDAIGTGTAQAGNLFQGGNQLQLQQMLGSIGAIPALQNSSLTQLGGANQLGLQQYGLQQNSIDALAQQYYFNQNAPFNLLSQYQQYISGPYGSSVNPSSSFFGPSPIGNQAGTTNPLNALMAQYFGGFG